MKKRLFSLIAWLLALTIITSLAPISAKADVVVIGEVDGDGVVTAADSLYILRYSVGLEHFTDSQMLASDIDGNGQVDAGDALVALRASVGVSGKEANDPFKDYAYNILEIFNKERAKANVPPLQLDEILCNAADLRAEEISYRRELEHLRKNGDNWETVLDDFHINWHFCGENIGGCLYAEKVCTMWLESPGHRKNILNPNFTKLGVGFYFNENSRYGYYWATDFIG